MITVIVPVYRIKEKYLRNCISSLLNQRRSDYKVILVDDGSPDNCGAICDEYSNDERITVIHQENQGVSVARNSAIRATDTKWLTFVDADDWVEPDYIENIYNVTSGDGNDSDIVMFEYSREYRNSNSLEKFRDTSGHLSRKEIDIVRKATFYKLLVDGVPNPYAVIALWNKVYRTNFLKDKGIWFVPEARKGQDRLFNADALNSTANIYYSHKLLYRYRCWEDSRTNRYDPKVPSLTSIEIENLQKTIIKHNLQDEASEYLKCRICTRLYTCMRLYYFHTSNEKALKSKIQDVSKLVNDEPYISALKTVKMNLLNTQEKIFVFLIRNHCYYAVYMLVRAKSSKTRRRLI